MEESLVLDGCKARMMKEPTEHEVSLFIEIIRLLLIEFSITNIIWVFDNFDTVLSSLRVKPTFH